MIKLISFNDFCLNFLMKILRSLKFLMGNNNYKAFNYSKGMSKEQLKKNLTPLQYQVTQNCGTQPPFKNQYYNFKKPGIYNCIVCKIPLFDSQTKYDSGSGWPAFYDQLKEAKIRKIVDKSHGMTRTQVRCGNCDSHLGHIFEDGPSDKTGMRYCINSASLNHQQKK